MVWQASEWILCFDAECKILWLSINYLEIHSNYWYHLWKFELTFSLTFSNILYTTTNKTITVCITYVTTLRFVLKFGGWGIESHLHNQQKEIIDIFSYYILKNIAGIAISGYTFLEVTIRAIRGTLWAMDSIDNIYHIKFEVWNP